MKQLILLILVFFTVVSTAFSQAANSGKSKLQVQFDSLYKKTIAVYQAGEIDRIPAMHRKMLLLAQKIKADSDLFVCDNIISNYFSIKSDFAQSIEYMQKAADVGERGFKERLCIAYNNIASNYVQLENYSSALHYLRKGQQAIPMDRRGDGRIAIDQSLAFVFYKLNKPDSALKYVEDADRANRVQKYSHDFMQASILRIFAEVHQLLKDPELANYYYKKAIRYADSLKFKPQLGRSAEFYGQYLYSQGQYGPAKNYILLDYSIVRASGTKKIIIETSDLLYKLYLKQGRQDSAFYYLQANHLYQDSLAAEQKNNQLQAIIVNQQIKETEQIAKVAQEEEQRKHNIQYAGIALGLVLLIMVFLLLSRSVIVNTRIIEIVGVIGLLIVFEFINLVIHPYLAQLTNDSPFLMLLILVLIAAIIVPLHHQLEHWIKHKLVEKNKAIRLAAAKRTIEQLEGGK
jgi:hypothetical protein